MRLWGALVLVSLLALVAACGSSDGAEDAAETGQAITATLLVEADSSDPRWTRELEVPKGTDGYEFLDAAVGGEIESDWFPEFRSHFVKSIQGIEPEGAQFWGVFVWNEGSEGWEPLPVEADLFSVKQGHVMAWALVEYDPDSQQLPVSTP